MNKINTAAPSNHYSSNVQYLSVRREDIKFLLMKSICVCLELLSGLAFSPFFNLPKENLHCHKSCLEQGLVSQESMKEKEGLLLALHLDLRPTPFHGLSC